MSLVASERFELIVDALAHEIEGTFDAYGQILRGSAGLFMASEFVKDAEWRQLVGALKIPQSAPALTTLAYVAAVKDSEQAAKLQAFINEQWSKNFVIAPVVPGQSSSIVIYTDPRADEDLGFDLASDPGYKSLMARAVASGDLVLSTIAVLQPAFASHGGSGSDRRAALVLPVFGRGHSTTTFQQRQDALEGFILAIIDIAAFEEHVMLANSTLLGPATKLRIDGATPGRTHQAVVSLIGQTPSPTARFSSNVSRSIYGQTWTLAFQSTPAFEQTVAHRWPDAILGAGITFSLLLSALSWAINRSKVEAIWGQERLMGILATSSDAIIIIDNEQRIAMFNEGASRTFGYLEHEVRGRHLNALIPQRFRPEHPASVETFTRSDTSSRKMAANRDVFALHKTGREVPVEAAISKVGQGSERLYTVVLRDITERKRYELQTQLLMREMEHRTKNMTGVLLAVARQTAAAGAEEFADSFSERVTAITICQDMLSRNDGGSIALRNLIEAQIAHLNPAAQPRITLTGPDLYITAAAAQSLGLVMYELATNASKYGALATEVGHVTVSWQIASRDYPDDTFALEWVEADGPSVTAPEHTGFGTTLISNMIEFALSAEVDLDYAPQGFSWRLTCPTEIVLDRSAPTGNCDSNDRSV
ncbi:MAG: PAS domain S-box protein [Hyphomicrobium sp.]